MAKKSVGGQKQMLLWVSECCNSVHKCNSYRSLKQYDANKPALLSGGYLQQGFPVTNFIPDVSPSRPESSGLTSDTGAAVHLADFTLWSW